MVQTTHQHDNDECIVLSSSSFASFSVEINPQKKKQRRQTWIIVTIVLALLVVCVSIIAATVSQDTGDLLNLESSPSPPPITTTTLAPTNNSIFRETTIQEIVKTVIDDDDDKLNNPNTPESKALDWIIHDDPLQLEPNDDDDFPKRLIQRYLLAYFYFHTSANGPWISCDPPVGEQQEKFPTCNHEDYLASSGTYRKFLRSRWLSRMNECQWAGIMCDDDEDDKSENNEWVVSIWLEGYHLSGSFPLEIFKMPQLKWLQMSYNELTGTLPRNFPAEKNFRLYLNDNSFVGSIPQEWYTPHPTNLTLIEIEGNHITGSIPTELALITSLQSIRLGSNHMTGTIPTEIFSLQLISVDLSNNTLVGTVPSEIGTCTNLFRYFNDRNPLTGTLPTEFALLSDMEYFTTQYTQLSGTIPEDIWKNWKKIEQFELESNHFHGTLSSWIGELHELDTLLLADNAFSGTIPSEIGQLSKLEKATFHWNNFTNISMPDEICNLRTTTPRSKLMELTADCASSDAQDGSNMEPSVQCMAACCTECCNKDTGICTNV